MFEFTFALAKCIDFASPAVAVQAKKKSPSETAVVVAALILTNDCSVLDNEIDPLSFLYPALPFTLSLVLFCCASHVIRVLC